MKEIVYKNVRYFFVGCCLLLAPLYARAQVIFTEIMYDADGTDTGREWIEIQNVGSSTIDFSTWKLFEANANHKITAIGDALIPSQSFAIIVDNIDAFKADNPQFSGLLFDSVFSLSNAGETIVLRDEALADSDSVTYSPAVGGQGDGTTLQKIATGWIAALPTIGAQTTAAESFHPVVTTETNVSTSTDSSVIEDTADTAVVRDSYSAHASQLSAVISRDAEELTVTAGRARLGFVGSPLSFDAKIKTLKNAPVCSLVGSWSMGDGTKYNGQSIAHTYQFPGEYIVILNADCGGLPAVSKIKVKIVEPQVALGFDLEGYTEIKNLSDFELNIGGWIVESERGRFIVPADTLIAKHSSIKLAGITTRIPFFKEYIHIANPSGFVLASLTPQQITFKGTLLDSLALVHIFEELSYQHK